MSKTKDERWLQEQQHNAAWMLEAMLECEGIVTNLDRRQAMRDEARRLRKDTLDKLNTHEDDGRKKT